MAICGKVRTGTRRKAAWERLCPAQRRSHQIPGLIKGCRDKHITARRDREEEEKALLFGSGWSSVTVKLNGVDRGGDGAAAVAPPLLLRLFVSEGLALGELEDVVGFLAPVPAGSPLSQQQNQQVSGHRRFWRSWAAFLTPPRSPWRQRSCLPDEDPRLRALRLSDGRVPLSERVFFFFNNRVSKP